MNRIICVILLLVGVAAGEAVPAPTVIAGAIYHLGTDGLAEWDEFSGSKPHGRQLDLEFEASANAGDGTLFIHQQNVKGSWHVMLNGRRIGSLEALAQPLVRALDVPAGLLRDGLNHLSIVPPPMLDDILVGGISLEPRPRAAVLSDGKLSISVRDSDSGDALPCRITLTDAVGALVPVHPDAGQRLAVRTGVVYTSDGRAQLGVAAGNYIIHAGRGFEYSVATERVSVERGESKSITLRIRREVPTPGLLASDTHIHTLTHSGHGDASLEERMLTIAGEGIELAVATEHNHQVDYSRAATQMGVDRHFRSIIGNEVTTAAGHFNAFPVPPDGPRPDHTLKDWTLLLRNIRSVTGAQVITLNHPRDRHNNFSPLGPGNFDARSGTLRNAADFDCDAIEVITSAAMQSDSMQLFRDWFSLLNRGLRVAAIAASDTHHVSEFILGQARTYVVCRDDDPNQVDLDEVWRSYREGRLLVSLGLLVKMVVQDRFSVGDLASGLERDVAVDIEVLGPGWTGADHVALFANGVMVREVRLAPTDVALKARVRWKIPKPAHDVHLVAIATGPGVTAPYWEIPRPYQPVSTRFTPRVIGATNPVWLDCDDDGRFTTAREYAARIIGAAEDPAHLVEILSGYDAAVAAQSADLWRLAGRDSREPTLLVALRQASADMRAAFEDAADGLAEDGR